MRIRWSSLGCSLAILQGCASAPPVWPDWVANPDVNPGVSAAECAASSGNLSLDRAQAATLARASVARMLESKVQAMDEVYAQKTASSGSGSGGVSRFTSVSKTLSERALSNTKLTKVEQVRNSAGDWVCVLLSLDEAASAGFAREVIGRSGVTTTAQTEALLLEQFRQKARAAQAPPGP
jgi:hypothetical protein